jgi:hypothetical protein
MSAREARPEDTSPGRGEGPEPGPDTRGGRLLTVTSGCPRCGSRPALRLTEELVQRVSRARRRTRIGTYQCQRRECRAIYDLYLGGGPSDAPPEEAA